MSRFSLGAMIEIKDVVGEIVFILFLKFRGLGLISLLFMPIIFIFFVKLIVPIIFFVLILFWFKVAL